MKKLLLHGRYLLATFLALLCTCAFADNINVSVNLMNGGPLTTEEVTNKTTVSFGINSAGTRVAADDVTAVVVFNNFTFHDNTHGLTPGTVTIKAPGNVQISVGNCAWGSDVTVKDADGNTACTFNTKNAGNCYAETNPERVTSGYYTGVATTLTVSGGSYWPYFAVKTTTEVSCHATFTKGTTSAIGAAPNTLSVVCGKKIGIPANRSLFVKGSTLTGWTDGNNTYAIGDSVEMKSDITLTPIFKANTKTLADRGGALTLKWFTCSIGGVPTYALEGSGNAVGAMVQQATIDGESIDVACLIDAANGKFTNANWSDWAQVNSGTIIRIPAGKGSKLESFAYGAFGASGKTATTIDGLSDYTSSTTLNYDYTGVKDDTMKIVVGNDAGYIRYIQMSYTKPEKTSYNDDVTVTWPNNLGTSNPSTGEVSIDGAFTITSNTVGSNLTIAGTGTDGTNTYNYTKYQPVTSNAVAGANGTNIDFMITPSKGLTFTPSELTFSATRYGTDGGFFDIYYVKDGKEILLQSGFKPGRATKSPAYTNASIALSDTLASSGECLIRFYLYGLGNTKQFGLYDVKIKGKVTGTLTPVKKFSLTTTVSPTAGGSITKKPSADEYDNGTEVTLTATRNFGYKFVGWNNTETGNVVSTDATIVQTMTANTQLTAKFEAIKTYSLTTGVTGGANNYMVSLSPSPTLIDSKNMYEEGTNVTLTASSNPLLKFTNWNSGETTSTIVVTMDKDQTCTASYDATDYIAGWDFYKSESPAAFKSDNNDATTLIMRTADGTTSSWLAKGFEQGGYENRNAAVNWQKLTDKYYFQTCINASAFTNIKVTSSMLYNYNAYQIQNVEYSLNETDWTKVGSMDLSTSAKTWVDSTFSLPIAANNQEKVYIRWIPDYTSSINGTTATNDGTTISGIYITGDKKFVNDGVAPVLVSQLPAANATDITNSGKIVLTFDEKVKISNGAYGEILQEGKTAGSSNKSEYQKITPTVTGKTVTFPYNSLSYSSNYTFNIAANSIGDLGDNYITSAISISFTTKSHPVITKGLYDFIVPDNGSLTDAIAAAGNRADKTVRYRIFVKKGSYELKGDGNTITVDSNAGTTAASPITTIGSPNISIIGEDEDNTLIWNLPAYEGIGVTATIQLTSAATGTYMQDLTLQNKYPYGNTTGRAVSLQDKSNKTICKQVKLLSYQDTYYSNNNSSRFYWEDSELHGVVDFLCGGGDVFYNACKLYVEARGGNGQVICAPGTPKKYGYVFSNCSIDGDAGANGNYYLGRPWGADIRAQYINTTMGIIPTTSGWTEMSGGYPKIMAEYNSVTSSGTSVDLSGRKKTFADTHTNEPTLLAADAAEYTISNVMGSDDEWDPTYYTEQAIVPQSVQISNGNLTWNNSDYVYCYAVCKNGNVIAFTTSNTYTVPADATPTDLFSVRAANEYGGLSRASETASISTGINEVTTSDTTNSSYYNLQGIQVNKTYRGIVIKVVSTNDGNKKVSKIMK